MQSYCFKSYQFERSAESFTRGFYFLHECRRASSGEVVDTRPVVVFTESNHFTPGNAVTYSILISGNDSTNWILRSGKESVICHSPQESGKASTILTCKSGNAVTICTLMSGNDSTTWILPKSFLPLNVQAPLLIPLSAKTKIGKMRRERIRKSDFVFFILANGSWTSAHLWAKLQSFFFFQLLPFFSSQIVRVWVCICDKKGWGPDQMIWS